MTPPNAPSTSSDFPDQMSDVIEALASAKHDTNTLFASIASRLDDPWRGGYSRPFQAFKGTPEGFRARTVAVWAQRDAGGVRRLGVARFSISRPKSPVRGRVVNSSRHKQLKSSATIAPQEEVPTEYPPFNVGCWSNAIVSKVVE